MSPLPSWHPLVVHFPIALVLVATGLLLAARLLRNESLAATAATVGTWNLCLGTAAAVVALATGLGAVLDEHRGEGLVASVSLDACDGGGQQGGVGVALTEDGVLAVELVDRGLRAQLELGGLADQAAWLGDVRWPSK